MESSPPSGTAWSTRRVLHDLEGHLAAALGGLQLVAPEERAALSPRARRALELTSESLTLARALLQASPAGATSGRARDGREHAAAVAATDVDPQAVAGAIARELAPLFTHARINVGSAPRVRASELALHRVLANLVSNACKHAGPSPNVRVWGTRDVATPGHVRLTVADDGPGIDPRDHLMLFLPKPESAAHGHGLPNALHLVAEQGGRLWIETQARIGTTIHLTLPAA